VILFLGINGTGKTTTVAKIANYLKRNGKRVVVAAGDTFRAGAIEQLSLLCQDIGVNLIKHEAGSDPASVAFDAIDHAKARNLDYVLIDSAGRMQTNKNLLEEMKKMKRVAKPDLTVLVLDAMIGQDAVYQAETFMKETSFDCVVLTKLDTDARGGAIITIADQLRKPVLFLGVGQGMDDIMEFSTEWYLDRVLPN
jgi:fused signal recognition particle receptor